MIQYHLTILRDAKTDFYTYSGLYLLKDHRLNGSVGFLGETLEEAVDRFKEMCKEIDVSSNIRIETFTFDETNRVNHLGYIPICDSDLARFVRTFRALRN